MKADVNDRDLDKELNQLLNELRVALPGVQVLFAFLLTVPFTPRFETLGDGDRRAYFLAVAGSAMASTCLIAPSAHHRVRFRDPVKAHMIRLANRLTIVGLVFLAAALGCSLYFVSHAIFASRTAAGFAAGFGAFTAALWFVVPMLIHRDREPGRRE